MRHLRLEVLEPVCLLIEMMEEKGRVSVSGAEGRLGKVVDSLGGDETQNTHSPTSF